MVSQRSFAALLSGLLLASAPLVSAVSCYLPDGQDLSVANPNNTYTACPSAAEGAQHGMCCDATGTPMFGGSKCMDNGLCIYGIGTTWREGCTDPTWQDPGCLKLYSSGIDATGTNRSQNIAWLDGCNGATSPGEYCEHAGSDACCAANNGYKIVNGVATQYNLTLPSSTSASTSTPTASAEPSTGVLPNDVSSSAPAPSTTDGGSAAGKSSGQTTNNTGAIVGGVVGGIVAILLLAILVVLALRKKGKGPDQDQDVLAGHGHAETGRFSGGGGGYDAAGSNAQAGYAHKNAYSVSSTLVSPRHEKTAWHGYEMDGSPPGGSFAHEMEHPRAELPTTYSYHPR